MIAKTMYIEDLVREYPKLVGPLKTAGIVCLACGEPVWGTLADQAREKGITDSDLDGIIDRMNAVLLKITKAELHSQGD